MPLRCLPFLCLILILLSFQMLEVGCHVRFFSHSSFSSSSLTPPATPSQFFYARSSCRHITPCPSLFLHLFFILICKLPPPSFSLSSPSHFFHELDGEVRLSLLSGTRLLPTFNVKGCRRRKTNKIIHILLPARLQAKPLLLPLKSTNRGNKKGCSHLLLLLKMMIMIIPVFFFS